ncbi:Hsp20/alpha crystallin family protein [Paenarthrobacter sp. DKR-5]|uniref:Hsp20/alpha crystallin family protein n=1 Tax=Paenarthrobacter sp. DKR-5 TaxID=2835535 RepID=UPI001BDC466C|nr:Hsp20/alpha crystallin family protein [Paenarthrobacter sp. DKR-5]MBT1004365.1 Hsp20/alpha crystallin family protein [Paenarthrobacter sp. DKR-5]
MSNIIPGAADFPVAVRRLMEGGSWLRVEQYQDGSDLVVRAELPGVDPDNDIDITVDDGVLTVAGRRTERAERRRWRSYRSEFRYGSFNRSFALPEGVSADSIQATYRDGVLEVRIPVPEEAREGRRTVPVKREDSPAEDAGPVAGFNF